MGSKDNFGWQKKVLLGAIVAPIAAIGIAGAVASFYNFTGFLDGQAASALGLVAAGEGSALMCALVMLLLTILGRPTPGAVRAGLWLLPIVAAGVGATLAPDLNMKVTAAVTPLAMTVAGEGIALVMRNVVAYRTGVDLEANRRAGLMVWHVRRANNGGAIGKRMSKLAVWRLAKQFASTDQQVSVQLADVQRYRIADGMDAGMASILDGTDKDASKAPAQPAAVPAPPAAPQLPAAPSQSLTKAPVASQSSAPMDDGYDFIKGVLEEAEANVATDPTLKLLTVAEVATLAGVTAGTVRSWVSRKKLSVADRDADGRSLFRQTDVSALLGS